MTDFYQLTPAQQADCYQRLASAVLPEWGLSHARLSMIKMRENAVFKLETGAGKTRVMRIHRAGYHADAALHSELQWIQALAKEGIETPEVIPTTSGRLFISDHSTLAGEPRQIDMFAWVEGEPLGSLEKGLQGDINTQKHNFRTIGELAARVHQQSSNWQLPAGFTRHAWDAEGLAGENPFWGPYWELDALSQTERRLMEKVRARVRQDLLEFGQSPDNYSLIHADLVPENIMVDGEQVRLIDFDDAGYGWHLFEIATSLYFNLPETGYDELQSELIKGYRSIRPLADAELEKLPLFLLARATTYLGWVHTRQETATAQELTPVLIEMACKVADQYLS